MIELQVADAKSRDAKTHVLECFQCGDKWTQRSYPPQLPLRAYRYCSACAAKRWAAEQRQKAWQRLRRQEREALH